MTFDPIDFLERAVGTPSHESVDDMRRLLVDTLVTAGLDPSIDDAGNVIAETGTGRPWIVLNTHIDTVRPHVPLVVREDTIHGRGACDAKGPLAAMLAAFIRTDPSEGRVTLAITPDEEQESTGADALAFDADGVIVGEPTGRDVCIGARGRFQGTVTLTGKGAHAAKPETGTNAIAGLQQVLTGIESYDRNRGTETHSRLGPPTLTPTLVTGGEASNRIPAKAVLTFDRRSVPPETEDGFFDGFESYLREQVPDELDVVVERAERETPFLEGFETDPDSAVAQALLAGGAGSSRPFGAATEASYFAQRAPTVVFGPGVLSDDDGAVAHSDREYVEKSAVRNAGTILTQALEDLVG